MKRNKKNKSALTVCIAVSLAVLLSLGVLSQGATQTQKENSDIISENEISINDVIGINNQNSEPIDEVIDPEEVDNQVATVDKEHNNEDAQALQNILPNEREDSDDLPDESSVTVSVDGYDLANATWPVSSKEIVMDYSYNTFPVYSETYNEYRSDHTGIDIKASIGEEVKCAYAGKVVEIAFDERLGRLVKVEHAEGVYSIYANLNDNVNVTLNQKIKEGDTVGTVGSSASSEVGEEPHLHFGVIAFGDYVNPSEYIKQ